MYQVVNQKNHISKASFHKQNHSMKMLKSLFMGSVALIALAIVPTSSSFAEGAKPIALTAKQSAKIKKEKELAIAKVKNDAAIKKANDMLLKMNTTLKELSLNKKEIEKQQSSLKNLLSHNDEITNLPEWIQSPIFKRLFYKQYQLRNQFETAKISLLPAHPRYRRLKARTTALNREIYRELSKIKIRLKQEFSSITKEEKKLQKSLKGLKEKVAAAKKDQYQLQTLSNQAEISLISAQKSSLQERTRLLDTALEKHGQNLLTSDANTSPRLVQLLDQFTDMSMELAELSTKWSSRHPRIRQTQNHLNLLQDQIADLARKEILDMDVMAQTLSAKEEALHKKAEALLLEKKSRTAALALALQNKAKPKAPIKAKIAPLNEAQNQNERFNKDEPLTLAYERKTEKKFPVDTTSLMKPSH